MSNLVLYGGVAALIAASLGHELTHAAIAVALGGEARIDWWQLDTDYRLAHQHRWAHYAVLLGPFAIGVAVGIGWIAVDGLPTIGPTSVLYALAWGLYTVGGGLDDFRIQTVGDAEAQESADATGVLSALRVDVAEHTGYLIAAIASFAVGWIIYRVGGLVGAGMQELLAGAAAGAWLAAAILLSLSVLTYDRDRRGEDALLPPSGD